VQLDSSAWSLRIALLEVCFTFTACNLHVITLRITTASVSHPFSSSISSILLSEWPHLSVDLTNSYLCTNIRCSEDYQALQAWCIWYSNMQNAYIRVGKVLFGSVLSNKSWTPNWTISSVQGFSQTSNWTIGSVQKRFSSGSVKFEPELNPKKVTG